MGAVREVGTLSIPGNEPAGSMTVSLTAVQLVPMPIPLPRPVPVPLPRPMAV